MAETQRRSSESTEETKQNENPSSISKIYLYSVHLLITDQINELSQGLPFFFFFFLGAFSRTREAFAELLK